MTSYSVIAKYYDKFTKQDCDYVRWSQYLYAVAKERNVKNVVDLACGTGKMTVLLAKSELDVTGVDVSSEMLSVAASKCRAKFILQDIRRLRLLKKADMATCVNDGFNYVKPSDLAKCFARIAENLKDGAPFVFDVSSAYKLLKVVGNNVFYYDDENETLLWSNELRSDNVKMSLTLFEKADERYIRRDEEHTQYVHETSDIVQALAQAGFELIEVTSDYGKTLNEQSQRLTFYAVKRCKNM